MVPRQPSGRSMPTISLPQRSTPVTDSVRKDMSVIWHTYDIHIHSPRNDKRSSKQAESIAVQFCKRERNPCAWDSAVFQMQAIRGFGAACTSGQRRADFMSRKGAMDFVPSTFSAT